MRGVRFHIRSFVYMLFVVCYVMVRNARDGERGTRIENTSRLRNYGDDVLSVLSVTLAAGYSSS